MSTALRDVRSEGYAAITLNPLERHNVFDGVVITGLTQTFEHTGTDPNVRVVVLQSTEKSLTPVWRIGTE